jgi:hypothetical protein
MSKVAPSSADHEPGYGKPPAKSRFRKGQSGNPKGRPRNKRNKPPYEAVLEQMVTIREDGVSRKVTAAEAYLLQLAKCGLEGDGAAARATLAAIEDSRRSDAGQTARIGRIVRVCISPGRVNSGLRALRMATKLDPYRPTARMVLEPWVVQAALERFGEHRLTRDEQFTVVRATRAPHKVNWPEWWEVK